MPETCRPFIYADRGAQPAWTVWLYVCDHDQHAAGSFDQMWREADRHLAELRRTWAAEVPC